MKVDWTAEKLAESMVASTAAATAAMTAVSKDRKTAAKMGLT